MELPSAIGKTLTFAVMCLFTLTFISIFGIEYSLLGMTLTISSMLMLSKDMSVRPLSHLLSLSAFFMLMCVGASLAALGPMIAFPVNTAIVFIIVFLTVSDLNSPIHFPMLMCYAALLIQPVPTGEVALVPVMMLVGSAFIVALNCIANHGRNRGVSHRAISLLCAEVLDAVSLTREGGSPDLDGLERMCTETNQVLHDRLRSHYVAAPSDRTVLDLSVSIMDVGRAACLHEGRPDVLDGISSVMVRIISYENGGDGLGSVRDAIRGVMDVDGGPHPSVASALLTLDSVMIRIDTVPDDGPLDRGHRGPTLIAALAEESRRDSMRYTFAVRMAVVFALVYFAGDYWDLPNSQWLLFTVLAAIVPYLEESWRMSALRVVGSLLGALTFLLIGFATGGGPVVDIAVTLLAGYALVLVDPKGYHVRILFLTVIALSMASLTSHSDAIAINHFGLTLAGIGVALVANRIVMPYRISDENLELAGRSLAMALEQIGNIRDVAITGSCHSGNASLTIMSANISRKMHMNLQRRPDPVTSRFLNDQDALTAQCASVYRTASSSDERVRARVVERIDSYMDIIGGGGGPRTFDDSDLGPLGEEFMSYVTDMLETYRRNRRTMHDMIVSNYMSQHRPS